MRNLLEQLSEVGLETVEVGTQDARLGEVIHELTVLFRANEAGGFELFHVMGEGRGADVDVLAEVAAGGGAGLGAKLFEDLIAARVGEGPGDQLDLIFGELDGLFQEAHGDWMFEITARRRASRRGRTPRFPGRQAG